jgi:hypothetical protein
MTFEKACGNYNTNGEVGFKSEGKKRQSPGAAVEV